MKLQTWLIALVGVVVGLVLAFCFFRVASLAFQLVTFLFWIAIGILFVMAAYSLLANRLRGKG